MTGMSCATGRCHASHHASTTHATSTAWITTSHPDPHRPVPCDTCAQKWSKREVLAQRAKTDKMSPDEYEAFDEKWSHEHEGQHFNRAPLLPFHDGMVLVDILHLYLNEFQDAIEEAFQSHLWRG